MPAGIEAVVEDGFATVDFINKSLRGPALEKLRKAGSKVTKETRVGPRARYVMPEADARAAGLIDGATGPGPLKYGDTGFAKVLQDVGMEGARPEQPTIRNHYSGATPAAAVMAIPGPSTTVSGSKPDNRIVTPIHGSVDQYGLYGLPVTAGDGSGVAADGVIDYVEPTTIHSPAITRPPTTEHITLDAPRQTPPSGVVTTVPRGAAAPDMTWTVADLKQYAADNGIDLGAATRKSDILATIQAAG
jgi:hypothetical protein